MVTETTPYTINKRKEDGNPSEKTGKILLSLFKGEKTGYTIHAKPKRKREGEGNTSFHIEAAGQDPSTKMGKEAGLCRKEEIVSRRRSVVSMRSAALSVEKSKRKEEQP